MQLQPDERIFRTLHADVKRGDFRQTVKREWAELKEMMLDEQRQQRLASMGSLRRWFVTLWWVFKSSFFKLTPARRILLAVGVILVLTSNVVVDTDAGVRFSSDTSRAGALCILFVLALELKDKLLARKELEAGRAIQEALRCEKNPNVAGWDFFLFTRSANEVGGDLVDFMRVDGERFGVVLADVSGKGLSAALLATRLQATLKAIVAEFSSLTQLGKKLNNVFCRDCIPSVFASLVYVEGKKDSGLLRILNAGHIPPFVVRNGEVETTQKGGPALGLLQNGSFAEQEIELDNGDFILIYSDGLSEAQNILGNFLDEQQLIALLSQLSHLKAEQIGESLIAEVDRFVGEANVHDDLSIAIIRRATYSPSGR